MAQFKHQFFHKGTDKQKRADITIDLRRPPKSQMEKWTTEEKEQAKLWLESVENIFERFKQQILS